MQIRSFEEAHKALEKFVPPLRSERGVYTLERMRKLMEALGNPQNTLKIIHVAGTSGKTSTCYYIAACLKQSGLKVGLTVSPHIDEVNERVQIDLVPMPEKKFCRELTKFLKLVEVSGVKPTYFELLVAFSYWEFAETKIDYAVIEVGLGGLLDGTNVVNRADKVCVITDIGLDHTNVLGKSLSAIASQKAGIITPHNTVFTYVQEDEVMDVIQEVCEQQTAELHEILKPVKSSVPHLPLFQQHNWHLARAVFEYVSERDSIRPLSAKDFMAASKVYIPARMETISYKGKIIIMDGAHNAQKMKALALSVRQKYPHQSIATLLSFVQSGNFKVRTSLKTMLSLSDYLIVTSFKTQADFRKYSVNPTRVADYCRELGYKDLAVIADPEEACMALLKRPEKVLLITGSFYLLNHIRPYLMKELK